MKKEMSGTEVKLNTAIFTWLPLKEGANVLCINIPDEVRSYFEIKNVKATFTQIIEGIKEQYDYVFAFEVLESAKEPSEYLTQLMKLLKTDGVLYLGTDNRLGLRYFCGDIEPGTHLAFSAIEDYNGVDKTTQLSTRLYARNEIEKFLDEVGCVNRKFYSVLPNLRAAQLVYADGYLPHERMATRYMPMYREPSVIFAREEWMYDSIIANGMFHQMANSYLVEIRREGICNEVLHATLSADRGEENSCATIIFPDRVEKHAIYPQGQKRLERILENDIDLRKHGVDVVESKMDNGAYWMPKVDAVILERYLQNLLIRDKKQFVEVFDKYRDVMYHSSDIIEQNERGPILKKCYLDLVPLNCFYINDKFLFYDQEFYLESEAANLILFRALVIIYDGNPTLNAIIPITDMMDRYGITPYAGEYAQKSGEFLRGLRNQEELAEFNDAHLRDINTVMENRRKVESTLIDWEAKKEQYKETCFDGLENKEIFVFGSGRFADEFICMYRYDYSITGVIDNNVEKQETVFYGYSIMSPEVLNGKNPDEYKVIVCVKNCEDILAQLHRMGAKNVGVYDIHYFYPGRQKYLPGKDGMAEQQIFYRAESAIETGATGKHYHIGYIAGVFDLFHLGHLNMFRRAKEMCDYLIVGVVSDEGVRINKKTEPFIPFDERIEMVRSCRYVDEAVEIPFVYCRTPEAFRKYHFDVQFSGSDYANDPGWLAMKDYLEEHGATLEFLSYTQQTSSTKIKALINSKLEGQEQSETEIAPQEQLPVIYHKAYTMICPYTLEQERYGWLKSLAAQSEKFILGIPDEWTFARIYGDSRGYDLAATKATLESWGWFEQVIVLSPQQLSYQKVYEELQFDTCFYGTEYGKTYEEDRRFFDEKGVKFVSTIPEVRMPVEEGVSLHFALENINRNQKIVLFGTGAYFDIYMNEFGNQKAKYKPVYAVDNNSDRWNSQKLGIDIADPMELSKENPKDVLVVLCGKNYQEMLEQLKTMGDFDYRILKGNNEIALLEEFSISAEMERLYLENSHRILTRLMEEFDRVCMEHHLHYYIICGSLIGVVRHKGMIPWDDDIDIAMPREDYKKLKKIAKRIWNKDNDVFQYLDYADIGGGAFLDCMPRLFYMKEKLPTKCFDKVMGKATADIEDRMFLDIYVMDRAHVNEKVHSFCTNIAMKGIYNLMMGHRTFVDYEEYRGTIDDKTLETMKKVHKLGSKLPIHFLAFWYDAFARSGNWNKKAPDVIMESCAIRCVELKYPREHFGEGQRVPFETIEVMIPSDYDAQLQDMRYRNYMEYPRMAVRKPSHYFNSDIEVW